MMTDQAEREKILRETIQEIGSVPGNEELFEKYGTLFGEGQRDGNKITEELADEYFKAVNSSVLPF